MAELLSFFAPLQPADEKLNLQPATASASNDTQFRHNPQMSAPGRSELHQEVEVIATASSSFTHPPVNPSCIFAS